MNSINKIKRLFSLLSLLIWGQLSICTAYATASLPQPIARWNFDGCVVGQPLATVADVTGGGADGAAKGGPVCTVGWNIQGGEFHGAGDAVEIADQPKFHLDHALTITAWVRVDASDANQNGTILNKWYSKDSYALIIEKGAFDFRVAFAEAGNMWGVMRNVTSPLITGAWTHVAGVFDGATHQLSLYVNGVLKATTSTLGLGDSNGETLQDSTRPLRLGTHPSWSSFAGRLDEVQIFDVALTPSEIAALMLPSYSISGSVINRSGQPVPNVTISAGGGRSVTTDSNGNYSLNGLSAGSYILSPALAGLAFSPASRTIAVPPDANGMNFQAGVEYSVSGRVVDELEHPITGARVTADTGISGLTNNNGEFTLNVPEGKRTFTVAKVGYTFPAIPSVQVAANVSGLKFKGYDKPPIVMVHGFNSNPDETFRPHESNIHAALENAGYFIELPTLKTQLEGNTPPIEQNVVYVMRAIDRAKTKTGQPKVIVIAHSMGGIVSRAYIEGTRYRGDVDALYTFGSPHLGAPRVVAWNVCLGGRGKQQGVCDMSPELMAVFNLSHRQRAGVTYHLIGGDAPMDTTAARICPKICIPTCLFGCWKCWTIFCWDIKLPAFLVPPYYRNFQGYVAGQLIPGKDDALISTDSATGEVGWIDRARTEEVHGEWAGVLSYFSNNNTKSFEQYKTTSYMKCLKKILVDKTTNTCGRWSSGSIVPIRTTAMKSLSIEQADLAAEPDMAVSMDEDTMEPVQQNSSIVTGTLLAGKKMTSEVPIEGGTTTFAVHWTNGSIDVSLLDPNGQKVDAAFADNNPDMVTYSADDTTALYEFKNAIPGNWKIVLRAGADVPAEGADYFAVATFNSTLAMTAQMDKNWYVPGTSATIQASLSELPTDAVVTASVSYNDGTVQTVPLEPNSSGGYEASLSVSDIPGYANVTVSAEGTNPEGVSFARSQYLAFQVSSNCAALSDNYNDSVEPRSDDPSLSQSLDVAVGINSSVSGRIGLSADLADKDGVTIVHALSSKDLTAGSDEILLSFPGEEIFSAQKNGPYHLTNLLLLDERTETEGLVLEEANDVYVTEAYDYRMFAERHDVPVVKVGGPYSVEEGGTVTLSASGSDPEGNALTFAWDLDDDGIFETSGQTVPFTATDLNGPNIYPIAVQVTDNNGFSVVGETTIDVMNVAPTVLAGGDEEIEEGETFFRSGTIVEPGPDSLSATVDYGDGTEVQPLTLSGNKFELEHDYPEIGTYPVNVTVVDSDQGKGTAVFTVTVRRHNDDMDGDGVADELDNCPYSDPMQTVVLGNCDSGVPNAVNDSGCTIFDSIGQCAIASQKKNDFKQCTNELFTTLKKEHAITAHEKEALMDCIKEIEFSKRKMRK